MNIQDPHDHATDAATRAQAASPQAHDPDYPVILRVEVESMRRQMYHMISAQMSGLNDLIEKEVNKALSAFRFDDRFYSEVVGTVERTVQDKVNSIVREALSETFDNEAVRRKVAKIVVKKITQPLWKAQRAKRAKR